MVNRCQKYAKPRDVISLPVIRIGLSETGRRVLHKIFAGGKSFNCEIILTSSTDKSLARKIPYSWSPGEPVPSGETKDAAAADDAGPTVTITIRDHKGEWRLRYRGIPTMYNKELEIIIDQSGKSSANAEDLDHVCMPTSSTGNIIKFDYYQDALVRPRYLRLMEIEVYNKSNDVADEQAIHQLILSGSEGANNAVGAEKLFRFD